MRILFAGTPEFAVPALQALIGSSHQVIAVYTQPDRPAGRGRKLQQSPVKACALAAGVPVMQPINFKNPEDISTLQRWEADLMIVAAYGLLLPQAVLDAPILGCVNIHASLLPRWRGAAPIQRALLAGDDQTGITLMQMDAGLDTGDMLASASVGVAADATAADLHDSLKKLGADLLMEHLEDIGRGAVVPRAQNDALATYAHKLTKQEAAMDWSKPAVQLEREIRAFNPWPVSFSSVAGRLVKVWSADLIDTTTRNAPGRVLAHNNDGVRVCCGSGVLNIRELQFAGKKRCAAGQLAHSTNLTDEIFGD